MARQRWVLRKLECQTCHARSEDLVADGAQPSPCSCGGARTKPDPVAPKSPTVFSDVIWGGPQYVENFGDEPIFVETKSQYRALCAAHGFENRVRHVPVPGTDRSPHTTRWDVGLPPGVDPRPFALLSPAEQVQRRASEAPRLGFTVDQLALISDNLESTLFEGQAAPRPSAEFIPHRRMPFDTSRYVDETIG